LNIFDLTGKLVSVLHAGPLAPGYHSFSWNAEGAASGIYVARMTAGKYTKKTVMTLMK
jgi:hypothetical protein